MDKETAFNLGKDCRENGANTNNCHFSIFSDPEFTKAWEEGKKKPDGNFIPKLNLNTKE